MKQFFNNIWSNVKDLYVKVRNFVARQITPCLQYGDKLINTVKALRTLGKEVSYMDYAKVVLGYTVNILTCVTFGIILAVLGAYVTLALSFVVGEFIATVFVIVVRTMFVIDVFEKVESLMIQDQIAEAVSKRIDRAIDNVEVAAA
jgi:hypothetical protein